jgi:uncharacterized protein (DUF58 family)
MASSTQLRVVRTPDKPGPGPMPDGVLRALDLTIGRRVAGLLAGDYRSSMLGIGTEFAQLRPYEPGDDVRLIDWNVTARMRQPHIRVQIADRVMTTWLMLDHSASMAFGTADRRKADVAEGVAIAVGHIATRHGNALGIVSFGNGQTETVAPSQGRVGMLSLLMAVRREPANPGAATSVGQALRHMNLLAQRSKVIVIVSDFRGRDDWSGPMTQLAGRNAVLAVEIRDPREQELPDIGEIHLVDPETGRQLRVDTSRRKIRERFAAAAAEERATVAAAIRKTGARHAVLSTSGDWLRAFAGFLSQREDRR